MPKKVFEGFYRTLVRDIQAGYQPGDKYLTLRQIAAKFGVAYGTADKGVKRLVGDGMVSTVPGSGTTVRSHRQRGDLSGKAIALLVPGPMLHDEPQAFRRGAESVAAPEGVKVDVVRSTFQRGVSYRFGEYIAGLGADGVIAAFFTNSALGMYHALNKGVDLVSDIYYEDLPILPVVQTDNYGNSRRAAQRFHRHRRDHIMIVSCNAFDRTVCQGYFSDRLAGFDSYAREAGMEYTTLTLTTPGAMGMLNAFLYHLDEHKGVFTLDVESNTIVATQFVRHGIPARDWNFVVYDSTTDHHHQQGLDPIPAAGPSLERLGAALAAKLIRKWKMGRFAEPLREMM